MTSLISSSLLTTISTSVTLATSASLISSALTATAADTSTTLTTTTTTTATAALTTPWVRPASCSHGHTTTRFTGTTITLGSSYPYTTVTSNVAIIYSENYRDECLPTGWDVNFGIDGNSRIVFSPGVCPSGWTAYNLQARSYGASTATCCSEGYTPEPDSYNGAGVLPARRAACISSISTPVTGLWQQTVSLATLAHDRVTVMWQAKDTTSLSPQPPTMTGCGYTEISSWVPGKTVEPSARTTCPPPEEQEHSAALGAIPQILGISLGVGIPCLLIFICGCCFCYQHDKDEEARDRAWRERKRAEREAVAAEVREAARLADIAAGIELDDVTHPESNVSRPSFSARPLPTYAEIETETSQRPAAEGDDPPSYAANHRRPDRQSATCRAD